MRERVFLDKTVVFLSSLITSNGFFEHKVDRAIWDRVEDFVTSNTMNSLWSLVELAVTHFRRYVVWAHHAWVIWCGRLGFVFRSPVCRWSIGMTRDVPLTGKNTMNTPCLVNGKVCRFVEVVDERLRSKQVHLLWGRCYPFGPIWYVESRVAKSAITT